MQNLLLRSLLVGLLVLGTACSPLAVSMAQPREIPPLYFFYVNHTHLREDYAPYRSLSLQQIDPGVADNLLETIEAIADRLDTHGVKASWEVVYGTAQGLCEYEGPDHIFRRLLGTGHEVGLHVHNHNDFERDYRALAEACGIEPTVTSGLRLGTANLPPAAGANLMAQAIGTNVEYGIATGTTNLTGTRFIESCNQNSAANETRAELGLQIHPWRVDWENAQFCEDSPAANFVIVEHVQMNPWTGGSNANQPDLLTAEHFANLQALFDDALRYMEETRPSELSAWGFVTHPHEFMPGESGEGGPDGDALVALDAFLAYVKQQELEGRVIFATAGEIAQLLLQG